MYYINNRTKRMVFVLLGIFIAQVSFAQLNTGLATLQFSTRNIAQQVLPTVVTIDTISTVKVPVRDFGFFFDPFNPFNGKEGEDQPSKEYEQEGVGSGIFVRKDGKTNTYYILTNAHVVDGANSISILTADEQEFEAKLVGIDKGRDLALISIVSKKEAFSIANLGNSDTLQQGDIVFAVGNPYGFRSSITFGIVSALDREASPGQSLSLTSYIQTDAAVNRGNSGGPLVNIDGDVIGINTWIYSSSGGGNEGLSFAVPINNAKGVIDDFIEKGSVDYGWLGAGIGKIFGEEMESLGQTEGVLILGIYEGSPAEKYGVKPGDIVLSVNGSKVEGDRDLINKITSVVPGEVATLEVYRNGKIEIYDVVLATRNVKDTDPDLGKLWPGFNVIDITGAIEKRLDISTNVGVVVVAVDKKSSSGVAGLRPGDVITRVNNKKITNMKDFYREIGKIRKDEEAVFRITRGETSLVVGIVYGDTQ